MQFDIVKLPFFLCSIIKQNKNNIFLHQLTDQHCKGSLIVAQNFHQNFILHIPSTVFKKVIAEKKKKDSF